MIRREVRFADGEPRWLLISQVEHARLSGELAGHCLSRFGDTNGKIDRVRQELFEAISHHDDGWIEWDRRPKLDEMGCPLSFLEWPVSESIEIWNRSISVAESIGDFAAWVVAGHFSVLLATVGRHSENQEARTWLPTTAERRRQWFESWHARDTQHHTAELAGQGLKWLQVFDLLSLWPCSQYPIREEIVTGYPEPYHLNDDTLVREVRPSRRQSPGEACRIVFDPWPFHEDELRVKASAHLVPARRYSSSDELLAAFAPCEAEWILTCDSGE